MVVDAQSGVEGQNPGYVLTNVDIAGQFIFMFVDKEAFGPGRFPGYVARQGTSAVAEPVEAYGRAVPLENAVD